jgi:hypothetical protein
MTTPGISPQFERRKAPPLLFYRTGQTNGFHAGS